MKARRKRMISLAGVIGEVVESLVELEAEHIGRRRAVVCNPEAVARVADAVSTFPDSARIKVVGNPHTALAELFVIDLGGVAA